MKIYITVNKCEDPENETFFTPKAMAALEAVGQVTRNPYTTQLTPQQLQEAVADTDVLLTGWGTHFLGADILNHAKNLKLIAHSGGSVGTLVDTYTAKRGIPVISGNNIFAKSVAEACIGYILASTRKLEANMALMRNNGWKSGLYRNSGLLYKRVGLVGYGAITGFLIEMLKPFETEILLYSSHLSPEETQKLGCHKASLEEIFTECDIISLHASMIEKNRKMISKTLLQMIKPGALFLNTARGGLVDEEALTEELGTGRFYAALDVYAQEPLAPQSPLRSLPNALLMPHMGGPTIELRELVVVRLAEDIARLQKGEPLQNQIPYEHFARMTGA